MRMEFRNSKRIFVAILLLTVGLLVCQSWAVTSKISRQSSNKDLSEGKAEGVVISSRGTIQLGQAAKVLATEFQDVWSVNSIIVSGGTIYIGTSPNGSIYKYRLGTLTRIYPDEGQSAEERKRPATPSNNPVAPNTEAEEEEGQPVEAEEQFSNEHIFAMGVDVAGRLIVGISGDKCRLCRFETGTMTTVFEPEDAKYIFAIETDDVGNIYLGTGPEGKIYVLDPSGKVAQLVYDSPDKNILSISAGRDGFVYAGSDTRGLVYKINPRNKSATVLYDSEEPEISSLLFAGGADPESGWLYALATSAKVVQTERKFAAETDVSGRPEPKEPADDDKSETEGGLKLQIANTKKEPEKKTASRSGPITRGDKPGTASYLYKITRQGYVTELFKEAAVFLCSSQSNGRILIGSGNNAQLFAVDPAAERDTILYEDDQAAQITALAVSNGDIYIGTANPARLILLSPDYASKGTYISDLIDAEQPAKWGKLQIDADIPPGTKVLVASRSGNVKDVNDPTFSDWTEAVEIIEPIQLRCPLGRFCQYKLVLEAQDGKKTPLIREIAVASTVPNLAPRMTSVEVGRLSGPGKEGTFKINYKADDDNEDKLLYKIDFRKVGRDKWIELKKDMESNSFEWDTKTVEDGRYEIRVIANDERSNSVATRLTSSRISDPIVVDNTGPVIRKYALEKSGQTATLKLQVTDELTAIGKVEYTLDSNDDWKSILPDDLIFDTTEESFTITTEELDPGEHIIAVRISDDVQNTIYKSYELSILAK